MLKPKLLVGSRIIVNLFLGRYAKGTVTQVRFPYIYVKFDEPMKSGQEGDWYHQELVSEIGRSD